MGKRLGRPLQGIAIRHQAGGADPGEERQHATEGRAPAVGPGECELAEVEVEEIDGLRIGHYIKINHRWFDHPFVRRMFQITAQRELDIIREMQLTRIFVDPERSVTEPAAPEQPEIVVPPDPDAPRAADGRVNLFAGTVTRASYFGDAMDYQVAIAGTACTLRAAGPPEPRFAVGQPVIARIEARACIVVR